MPPWVSMMNNVDKVELTGTSINIIAANTVQTIYDHSQQTAYYDSFNTYTNLTSSNRPGASSDRTPSQEETSYPARKKKKRKNRRKPKSPQNFDLSPHDGSGSANDPFEKDISSGGGNNWYRDNSNKRPSLSEVQDEGATSEGEDLLCHSMENMGFHYRGFPKNYLSSSPPARHNLPAHSTSNIGPNPLDAASVVYLDNKVSTINYKSGNTNKQKFSDSFNDSSTTRISRRDVRQHRITS